MKKVLAVPGIVLLACICMVSTTRAQNASVEVSNPDLINRFWNNIPMDVSGKTNVSLVDGTVEDCANLAMRRFKRTINNEVTADAMVRAVNTLFSVVGVVVPGGFAKYAFTAAKMTFKALTAESAEQFETEAVKEAIKQIGTAGINIPNEALLTKALKEMYKGIVDGLFGSNKNLLTKNLTREPCTNGSIIMEIVPPKDNEPLNQYKMIFTIDEQCDCKYPPAVLQPTIKLKSYSIWGEMTISIDDIEYVDRTWPFSDKVNVTLSYGEAQYRVRAECDCGDVSFIGDESISYDDDLFAGLSVINEHSNERFNTYGGNVAYTRRLSKSIGLTLDAGANFGSQMEVKYTKLQLLGGVTYFTSANTEKLSFAPHALVGIVNLRSKYSMFPTSHSTNLSIAVGTDVRIPLPGRVNGAVRVDYNPMIRNEQASHNFRLGAGVVINL